MPLGHADALGRVHFKDLLDLAERLLLQVVRLLQPAQDAVLFPLEVPGLCIGRLDEPNFVSELARLDFPHFLHLLRKHRFIHRRPLAKALLPHLGLNFAFAFELLLHSFVVVFNLFLQRPFKNSGFF